MTDQYSLVLSSGHTLLLRRAKRSDLATICDFNARLAFETEGMELDDGRLSAGVGAVLGDTGKGLYWLAEVKGVVVGQLMITWEWSDWRNGVFWWIQSVYVHPDWRAQGVFTALFEFVRDQARERGDVCGIRLYVEEGNVRAKSAYKRLGLQATHYELLEQDFRLRCGS